MRQLDEFFDYKNKLMEDILTRDTIVNLLTDDPNIRANPRMLMYKQVFPYEYVPETVEHGKTYICFDVEIEKSYSKTYLQAELYIWVFSHKSLLRLPNGEGVRTDKLCSEICEVINGSRYYGLGELIFYSSKRFAPSSEYQGKSMLYYADDYNLLSPTGKKVPSNRKAGV